MSTDMNVLAHFLFYSLQETVDLSNGCTLYTLFQAIARCSEVEYGSSGPKWELLMLVAIDQLCRAVPDVAVISSCCRVMAGSLQNAVNHTIMYKHM